MTKRPSGTSNVAAGVQIRILSPDGLKPAMIELVMQFEKSSGHKVTIDYGTVRVLTDRIQKGDAADVAIATRQQIAALVQQRRITEGTPVDIAKQGVGLFVRQGAPRPDISSVETFKRTLLAAKSIGHADPAGGGAISAYVAALLDRLDIAADIKLKIRVFPPSDYRLISGGDIEIAFGGLSEISAASGVKLVGPLPAAFQNYTLFTAGIVASSTVQEAGNALLQFLRTPDSEAILRTRGYELPDAAQL